MFKVAILQKRSINEQMSSRDITFAVDNLTKVFRIKKSDDLELSKGSEGIPHCEAYRCNSCKKILIDYANR